MVHTNISCPKADSCFSSLDIKKEGWETVNICFGCKRCGEHCKNYNPKEYNWKTPCINSLDRTSCSRYDSIRDVSIKRTCETCKYSNRNNDGVSKCPPISISKKKGCGLDRDYYSWDPIEEKKRIETCTAEPEECPACKYSAKNNNGEAKCPRNNVKYKWEPVEKKKSVVITDQQGIWSLWNRFKEENKVVRSDDFGLKWAYKPILDAMTHGYYPDKLNSPFFIVNSPFFTDRWEKAKMTEKEDLEREISNLQKKVSETESEIGRTLKNFTMYSCTSKKHKGDEYSDWCVHIVSEDFIKYLKEQKNLPKSDLSILRKAKYDESRKNSYFKREKIELIAQAIALIEKYGEKYEIYKLKKKLCDMTDCYKKLKKPECRDCGAKIQEGAKFCHLCGASAS